MNHESSPPRGLIILDRDGVLNEVVIDAEHGRIDSPLHPDQVQLVAGVPEALRRLCEAGFQLAIATNQPAAAKGKTTRANLESAHRRVLELAQAAGAQIASSHLCFHTAQDGCECRKPKAGLLREAIARYPSLSLAQSWMVGDGVTDLEAGRAVGIRTAFLGPQKCDACKILKQKSLEPDIWAEDLAGFVRRLLA
jgi:histidinol-phosphate phosphatase family protein